MKVVVDTNVILVANKQHSEASPACVIACIDALENIKRAGKVVIDDKYRILGEYQNKTTPVLNKRVGDAFVLWLLKNSGSTSRVEKVSLSESGADNYVEFPDQALQPAVDPPDRKFIAAAAAAGGAPILQATDCKWLDWWQPLLKARVEVRFLCPGDVCAVYARKFPEAEVPPLP